MKLQGIWRVARCEIAVSISLSPSSPLLIQAPKDDKDNKKETGHAWKKKGDPEKAICVSYERGGKIVYYIPGSSLKGVLRAHTEKVFWHLFPQMRGKEAAEGEEQMAEAKTAEEKSRFYRRLDYVSQLFGHAKFRGRLTVDDAHFLPLGSFDFERRTNIAIDRFRGGSKNGVLFTVEPIRLGKATTCIRLQNPEIWQIAWLCFLLRDWKEGKITVGAKSAVGFGRLEVGIQSLDLHMYDKELEREWEESGVFRNSEVEQGLYRTYRFRQLDDLAKNVEAAWREWMEKGGEL